jgi:glycerol-3-phosphate dehydrogenase (NAD(P)+)
MTGARRAGFDRAVVVGSTAWGTTLSILLARNRTPATLLVRTAEEAERLNRERENARRLSGFEFPEGMSVSADLAVLREADLICFAVPSRTFAANAAAVAPHASRQATLLSATKGIDVESGQRMSQLLAAAMPGRPIAVLSGPNLSHELAAGLPGTTVVASADASLDAVRAAFHSTLFRVYTSADVVGVELGGALKNLIAIAAGMVDALGYGDNARAAVVTRGLAEMTRLGVAAGADALTFQGLAGMGDLVATAYSPLSRNRRLGELIANGASLDEALTTLDETVEGAVTVPAALRMARELDVEMPITAALHRILFEGAAPRDAVIDLMEREPKAELAGTR